MDKNIRPYCISLDWLSVSCRNQGFLFFDKEEQPSGYKLVSLGHGSKVFRRLFEVYSPEGDLIGELSAEPCNKAMDASCVIFKADNALLYQQDGVEQFFAAITALALYYKGINRLDIACDFNEFYGGMHPQKLIKMYEFSNPAKRWLKLGINEYWSYTNQRYYGVVAGDTFKAWSKMPLAKPEERERRAEQIKQSNSELEKAGLPAIDQREAHTLEAVPGLMRGSLTWGKRGCSVQTQFYNKTKELQEQSLKHYIVDAWRAAGLDVSRDVYRVEFRIMGRGKGIINLQTGKQFEVNLIDVVLQEQIQELFFSYAEKYFKFFRPKGKVKLRQNEPITLWQKISPILKPKLPRPVKNPTRFTLVIVNAIEKEKAGLKVAEKRMIDAGKLVEAREMKLQAMQLEKVSEYYQSAYDIGEWVKFHELEAKFANEDFEKPTPPVMRTHGSWYFTSVYEQALAKARQWSTRAKQGEGRINYNWREYINAEIDHEHVFDVTPSKLLKAQELSMRTMVYNEYISKDELPFPLPLPDTEEPVIVDWDNINSII